MLPQMARFLFSFFKWLSNILLYVYIAHHLYLFLFFKNFIYLLLFLAVLGLLCCAWASSSCGEWGLLFIAVHKLLIAVASLVKHGLYVCGLQ